LARDLLRRTKLRARVHAEILPRVVKSERLPAP
jgi:hypothetical protein